MNITANYNLPEVHTARAQAPAEAAPHAAAAQPDERVARAAESVSEMLRPMARSLSFLVDQKTGETVVRIVDATTNEVLRQIPSEEMLAIARALDRMQGLLIRNKA